MASLETSLKFFQKMLILAFEVNSALSRENETKIVKITHSAVVVGYTNYLEVNRTIDYILIL